MILIINSILVLVWLSTDTIERTEQLLYPLESFVSEFGGALGLFLGFSFLMVWEVLEGFTKFGSKEYTLENIMMTLSI